MDGIKKRIAQFKSEKEKLKGENEELQSVIEFLEVEKESAEDYNKKLEKTIEEVSIETWHLRNTTKCMYSLLNAARTQEIIQ